MAVAATALGAVFHSSRSVTDCASNPCVVYRDYGWPLKWKTSTPWRLIEHTEMDEGFFGYDENGFAVGPFIATAIGWFFVALVGEMLLFYWARRVWRRDVA